MYDLWGFLLQTLTASGVAVLLLILRLLFRDKLPPRWHWSLWAVLGIVILFPTGINGRHILINWQVYVELLKGMAGDFSYIKVHFPVPVIREVPDSWSEWLYAGYTVGALGHVVFYLLSYGILRCRIHQGYPVKNEQIQRVAETYQLKCPPVVELENTSSAFVCGILRPVLVLPAGTALDDKVILHELLHLKNHDTLWTVAICILRCLHWCNPLLVYCAKRAANDMEAACDQSVLERVNGEERRDYGQILLSMAHERYCKTPGSTCLYNGARNITQRIEAIVRFKKYPKGMRLVSNCALLLLTFAMIYGVEAGEVNFKSDRGAGYWAYDMALARSTPCTTPDAAFDTYGKAVLAQNGYYRMMCAPQSLMEELTAELRNSRMEMVYPEWNTGIASWPASESYYVYNLKNQKDVYEGLMVIKLNYPPGGDPGKDGYMYLAVQNVKVYKEDGRWVADPLDAWETVEALEQDLQWGCLELPALRYTGTSENVQAEIDLQTIYWTESTVSAGTNYWGESGYMYDTTPNGNIRFTIASKMQHVQCVHLGTQEERDTMSQIGLSVAPVYPGEERPDTLEAADSTSTSGSNSHGEVCSGTELEIGWGPEIPMGGGGSTFGPAEDVAIPEYYAADLYINNAFAASMDLKIAGGDGE